MKSILLFYVVSSAAYVAAVSHNRDSTDLLRRALTPDNTCGLVNGGNGKGYTCDPNLAQGGPCCSGGGYCGSSAAYCGSGCQSSYGTCGTGSSSSSSTTTSSGAAPIGTSTDGCGPQNGNQICAPGYCCSGNGYCGKTSDYCSGNCQPSFGTCGNLPSTTTSATGPGRTGSTYLCGPSNGNAICATGLCCSPEGYCGTGSDYCADPDCLFNFGTCDSDMTPAGTSTITDPRPLLGSITYSDDIYNCVQANAVALTYDDGPLNYTNQLLDILKQYNFKATFFITGNNVHKGPIDVTAPYPSVIRRMVAEGHQVASHTWSHYDLSTLTSAQRIQQMVKNERAIANLIGKYPVYMRPPYSSCSQASGCWDDMLRLGYHRTYFDLDTQDYLNPTPEMIQNSKDIVQSALNNASQGSDFLSIQHDIVQQSVANLSSYYFDIIRSKGWKGITVGECLGDPESNWYRVPGTGQGAPVSSSSTTSSSTTTTTTTTKSADPSITSTSIVTVTSTQGQPFTSLTVSSVPGVSYSTTTIVATGPITSSLTTSSTTTSSTTMSSTTTSTTRSSTTAVSTTSRSTMTTTTIVAPTTSTTRSSTTMSSTTSTSTTSRSSTPTTTIAAPTPTCDQPPSGSFCGRIAPFRSRGGCRIAYDDCLMQQTNCKHKASRKTCSDWGKECASLGQYCTRCGFHCSDKTFRAGR